MNRGKYGAKGLESKGVFTIYYCFRLHFHLIGQPPKHLFPDWWDSDVEIIIDPSACKYDYRKPFCRLLAYLVALSKFTLINFALYISARFSIF